MAAAGALGAVNILLGLDTRTFTAALSKAGYQSQNFSRNFSSEMRRMQRNAQELTRSMQTIRTSAARLATSFAGAFGAAEIVRAADAYGQMASRIRNATETASEFSKIQDQLYAVSNRTYKSFEDAAELFTRISGSLRQLGYDSQKAADLVSTVQFGLTLDSTSPQQTQSVINAISKSILQGKLAMQEFNTIVGASPTLFQALADSIAGGSQKALRDMVAAGQVTAQQLVKVTEQMDKLGKAADEMPTSVGDAFTKLSNNVTRFIGETDSATGATGQLVAVVDYAADHVKELANAFLMFGTYKASTGIANYVSGYAEQIRRAYQLQKERQTLAQSAVKNAQMEMAVAEINLRTAQATSLLTGNTKALSAAQKTATAATNALQAAQAAATQTTSSLAIAGRGLLSVIGGWPGVIGLGITALVTLFSQVGGESNKAIQTTDRLKQSTKEYREEIEKLTQAERNRDIIQLQKKLEEQQNKLKNLSPFGPNLKERDVIGAGTGYEFVFRQAREEIEAIAAQAKDGSLSIDKIGQKISEAVGKFNDAQGQMGVNERFAKRATDAMTEFGAANVEAARAVQETHEKIRANNEASAKSTQKMASDTKQAAQDAQKYLDDLQDRIATMGMNLSQKYAFEIDAKGGNKEQVEQAKFLGELEQKNKDLATAVQEGNAKQIDAIRQSIIALVEQRNEMRLNAIQAEETAQAMQQNDEQSKRLRAKMAEARSQYREDLKLAEDLFNRTTTNVQARPARARSSAGRGGAARATREQESELQRLVKQLKEEQDQLGMTRLEQQYYKIEKAKGAQSLKDEAREIARNISLRKEQMEVDKQSRLLQRELADFRDQQDFDYITAGIGNRSRDFIRKQVDISNEYSRQRRQLEENQLAESTRISDEAYQAQLDSLDAAEQAKLEILAKSHAKKLELDASWVAGAKEAMNNYIDNAIDVNAQFESIFTNAMGGLENAFTDFVLTGKAGWKDMIDSMISDLMRFAVRYAVMAPIFQGLTRILPSIGSPGSTMINTIGLASGGYVRGPGTGTSDSIPAWLSNGEAVLTAREVKALGGAVGFDALRRMIARYGAATPLQIRQTFPGMKRNMPAFANGGIVGNAGASAGTPLNNGGTVNVNVIDQTSAGIAATSANYDVESQVLNIVVNDIHRGGRVAKAVKGAM